MLIWLIPLQLQNRTDLSLFRSSFTRSKLTDRFFQCSSKSWVISILISQIQFFSDSLFPEKENLKKERFIIFSSKLRSAKFSHHSWVWFQTLPVWFSSPPPSSSSSSFLQSPLRFTIIFLLHWFRLFENSIIYNAFSCAPLLGFGGWQQWETRIWRIW